MMPYPQRRRNCNHVNEMQKEHTRKEYKKATCPLKHCKHRLFPQMVNSGRWDPSKRLRSPPNGTLLPWMLHQSAATIRVLFLCRHTVTPRFNSYHSCKLYVLDDTSGLKVILSDASDPWIGGNSCSRGNRPAGHTRLAYHNYCITPRCQVSGYHKDPIFTGRRKALSASQNHDESGGMCEPK